jgi:O-antigen biosynthesis protein
MTLVEIVDVVKTELDAEQLQGRNIEAPKTGSRIDGDTLLVVGWALGRSSPALTVEIVHDGTVMRSAPIDVQRPDITAAFPEVPGAEQSGFRTTVAIPDTGESELFVQAVLRDESRVPLGVIRAQQRRSSEERYSESSVQDRSGPLTRFFRRVLGRGGG